MLALAHFQQMFAQFQQHFQSWGFGEFLVAIVVVAALIAVAYAICQYMGVPIPSVIIRIFWIVICAAVAIWAIRFLLSL